jgi:P4 family phage/plasmid primase-like protien
MVMLQKNAVRECFGEDGYTNTEKDIYDEAMVRKAGWFFYGESKPDVPSYSLAAVYRYEPGEEDYDEEENAVSVNLVDESTEAYTEEDLIQLLSIRYGLADNPFAEVREDAIEFWEETKQRCAAHIPAIPPPRGAAAASPALSTADGGETPVELSIGPSLLSVMPTQPYTDDEIALAKQLVLECLNQTRADSYQDWLNVGWCLHCIDSSEEMFETWCDFSRKSPKALGNDWARMKRDWITNWGRGQVDDRSRRLKFGSLHIWAKEDNPTKYAEVIEGDIINYIEFHVDNCHNHVARIMQRMFKDQYRASVGERNTDWYEFEGHSWQAMPQGMEMKNRISTDVAGMVDKARARTRRRLIDSQDNELSRKVEEERLKRLCQIEKSLYSNSFKQSVMSECVGLFYEKDFSRKLDANGNLIGCGNGVIELQATITDPRTGQQRTGIEFRPGRASDHISLLVGRNYPETEAINYIPYDPNSKEQKELADFFSKLFPMKDLREYMLRLLSSCLEGANREQSFYTWIGVGGNGKSKLLELLRVTLGDYWVSLAATAMTRKRPESGAANPDIIAVKNRRFIALQEPDEREPLNTSRMKQFSGEDIVEARGMFKDQDKFKIVGKMFMLCNKRPPIHSMDRGTWRRIKVIPFVAKFVDPAVEPVNPALNIFPIDRSLDAKILQWREAFFSLLVHVYDTQYLKQGLNPIPAIVTQESDKYREAFDSFAKFKNARIRREVGEKTTIKELCRAYKTWMEEFGSGGGKTLAGPELETRFIEEYGEPADKKTFQHIRLFYSDEDVEAFDQEKSGSA